MPFDPVDPKQSFPALERGILKYWKEEDVFKRSIHLRGDSGGDPLDAPGKKNPATRNPQPATSFSFYDGPPFATGLPHYGHLLAGTIKDVIPRFQTMRGKRVERRFGWDCHGLPIENIIEKENNLSSKQDIEKMGVKAFNDLCRKAVQRYTKEWRIVVERMGRWVDMDWDYRTMDPEYMESIWWVFRSLWDKKLIYEGHKPMHICPRCVTPLSNFEVTQGYAERTDMSTIATFPLVDDPNTVLLAWTTTTWSLPGDLWLGLGQKIAYVKVQQEGDPHTYIVAKKLVEAVFKDRQHTVLGPIDAKTLVGKRYQPLFDYYVDTPMPSTVGTKKPKTFGEAAFDIIFHPEVSEDEGTGIVHFANTNAEDGYLLAKELGVDLLHYFGMDGRFYASVRDFAGLQIKPYEGDPMKTDKTIIEKLKQMGRHFKSYTISHSYPHCWRCDSPLLNYATSSWFVAVEKIKKTMLEANAKTEWVPAHLRDGRFGNWLEGARDWAISRNRYWGTPLPIWRNDDSGDIEVLGSREDLMRKKPIRFTRVTALRHAESDGNLKPVYQGKLPGTDLTKRGNAQATATAESLKTEDVVRIYCSPLARTKQTAELIAKATGAEVVVDERLREVEFGEFEGKSIDFSDLTFVKARRAHKLEKNQIESIYHFPGMETWSQVHARTSQTMNELMEKHRGEHIVIVTHADPLMTLKHFFTGEDPAKLCEQPYPRFAEPLEFYWDHDKNTSLDLHKEVVDDITWPGSETDASVNVTLVRHGETEWNKKSIIQGGEGDDPLNATGRAQAEALAETLAKGGQTFDAVLSSDLKRADETAVIIAKHLGIPHAAQWKELQERYVGEWNGMPFADVMRDHPAVHERETPTFHRMTGPGGESLSQFLARMQKGYDRILREFSGKRVLVVAHMGAVRGLSALADGLSHAETLSQASLGNAETREIMVNPLFRRIPEVLDCWFESGSMPYAQNHFPFQSYGSRVTGYEKSRNSKLETRNQFPPGFPANFIAEGIDQTRGWFYTLTVLSAALFKEPAFHHCVVNGTVLAEDGKKMSKRLKNYPEPLEVVEKHGADAVRFALMSSPAVRGEDLRFSEKTVEESLRNVILPLWNTYSFFVTYANAAKWQPGETRRSSNHPLDTWIRAETQDLVNRMTEQFEGYDLSATCAELHDTIDSLTNWYVRLSRRRFAGKAGLSGPAEAMEEMNEQDRLDALVTLYDVLLTVTQLIAPFCPFVADAIYLNLVSEEHGSVHLTDWPQVRALSPLEKSLIKKARVLRTIVTLGLKVRAERKIKTRQPLAQATVAVPASILDDAINDAELRLLEEELNVKNVELVDDPGDLADAIAMVDARKAGPRFGARVQELIAAGKRGEFTVRDDGTVLIGEEILNPGEVSVVYRGKEGQDVAADKGIVVALDTRVDDKLKSEGQARELIRAVQKLRKDMGYSFGDTITIGIEGADDILKDHGQTLQSAACVSLGLKDGERHAIEIDDRTVTVIITQRS